MNNTNTNNNAKEVDINKVISDIRGIVFNIGYCEYDLDINNRITELSKYLNNLEYSILGNINSNSNSNNDSNSKSTYKQLQDIWRIEV